MQSSMRRYFTLLNLTFYKYLCAIHITYVICYFVFFFHVRFSKWSLQLRLPPDMVSDDITKAAQCAQIVLNTEGFKAWYGWEKKCKPIIGNLPPLNECFTRNAIAG